MKIGDVVIPVGDTVLACGCAIVASVEPFVLVSVEADMLWGAGVLPWEVRALCQASPEVVERAVKRYGEYAGLVAGSRDGVRVPGKECRERRWLAVVRRACAFLRVAVGRLVLRLLAWWAYVVWLRCESRLVDAWSFPCVGTAALVAAMLRAKEAREVHERFQKHMANVRIAKM
jgi:hypothetical protein